MSSVLRPVGPEPRERYWVRRLAVLVAAVVAIGIVIALVGNAMSAGSAVQAEPAPPSVVPPSFPVTPSASPTPIDSVSPTPSGSPTPDATTGTPSPSDSATPGDVVTPDPGQTATAQKSSAPTATDKAKAQQRSAEKKAAAKKKDAAAKKKAKPAVLAACPASGLRALVTGPKKVKATKSATFALSLINGSGKPCYLKVTSANFTLTVVSGKDRIWSSDDCPAAVPAQSRKLAAEKSVDWKVTWTGQRSAPRCKNSSEKPRPGYYWAIASFDDVKPVRWRVILT